MSYSAEDILLEREKRVEFQNKLMKMYGMPLLFMRVNYPGLNKDNTLTNSIIQDMDNIVTDIFSSYIKLRLFRITAEGPNVTIILDKDPIDIKRTAILVENNHTLGRCIDIDVYNNVTGIAVSRINLGMEQRRCYLCDDMAQNCIRSRRHSESEVIRFIHEAYKEFLESFYGKKYN